MKALYENQIIDYNDGYTEFVEEFNAEVAKYGAVVYNHENNSYQFIAKFEQIAFKQEIGPFYFKAKNSKLPNGIDIVMSYEFDPEVEDDDEVLAMWKDLVEEEIPYYDYNEDDGELYQSKGIKYNAEPSIHTIWMLNQNGYDFVMSHDMLLVQPVIKFVKIAKELILNHTTAVFDAPKH